MTWKVFKEDLMKTCNNYVINRIKQFLARKRLERARHVSREKDSLIKKVTENKPIGRIPRGRP